MGGIGSGRRYQGGKETTSDYRSLDVRRLQRDDLLVPGRSFGWNWYSNDEKVASIQIHTQADRVILDYRHRKGDEEWKALFYPVLLDWRACCFGGRRAWFLSGKRMRSTSSTALYRRLRHFRLPPLLSVSLACQRETLDDRAARRADKIRDRLAWNRGILNEKGFKPKGMHWSTYRRLTDQHDVFVNLSLVGLPAD